MSDYAVLDLEYVGEPWDGKLLCVGWNDKAYIEPLPQDIIDGLADPTVTKVTFTKVDHRWLRLYGVEVNGPEHDVQVQAWLLDEAQDLSLEAVALRYCGIVMDKRISTRGDRLVFRCDDGTIVPLEDAPLDQLLTYNERDLAATGEAYLTLLGLLEQAELLDYWLAEQVPFTHTLSAMECRGVPVDMERSEQLRIELTEEMAKLDVELHADADLPDAFNLGSSKQLAKYLYQKRFALKAKVEVPAVVLEAPKAERIALMQERAPRRFVVSRVGTKYAHGEYALDGRGLKVHARTEKDAPSTATPKLRTFYGEDPWIMKLLEYKQRDTIVGTFLNGFRRRARTTNQWGQIARRGEHGEHGHLNLLDEWELCTDLKCKLTSRIHGQFKQTGTVTGRLSSSDPNLQNIPARTELGKRVRELFRPESGFFVHGDYSQLEPRLMAHWSQDLVLLDVFRQEKDIYRVTAAYIFGVGYDEVSDRQRGICKTLVLAMGYGAGAAKLAMILTEAGYPTDEATAAMYLKELKALYRVFFGWKEDVIRMAGIAGFVLTLSGRRRRLVANPTRGDNWKQTELTETQAVNAVIQGSAADVVQRTMIGAAQVLPHFELLVQVHDELLWWLLNQPAPFELYKLQRLAERSHGFRLTVPLVFEPKVVDTWAAGK